MGFLPQVKCSRCDRQYSGLRARCPYCGARRSSKGKRAADADNSTWKLVIGILLMVALIAAVVVLLVNAHNEKKANTDGQDGANPDTSQSGGVSSVDGTNPGDSTQPGTDEPTQPDPVIDEPDPPIVIDPPTINAESIMITYAGREKTDFTMKVSEEVQLKVKTVPAEITNTPVWESSNTSVFQVLQSGLVIGVGKGTATLTVTVDGVSAKCIVRVK